MVNDSRFLNWNFNHMTAVRDIDATQTLWGFPVVAKFRAEEPVKCLKFFFYSFFSVMGFAMIKIEISTEKMAIFGSELNSV